MVRFHPAPAARRHRPAGAAFILTLALGCGSDDGPVNRDTADGVVIPLTDGLQLSPPPATVIGETLSGTLGVYVNQQPDLLVVAPILADPSEGWGYSSDTSSLSVWPECANGFRGCGTGFSFDGLVDAAYTLTTESGGVEFGTNYAGTSTVVTTSGLVSGGGIGPALLNIVSQTGPIDLTFAVPPGAVTAETNTAEITLMVPRGSYRLEITTTGEIYTAEVQEDGSGPTLKLTSVTGKISVIGI